MFPDANGNNTTVGTVEFAGSWKIQHRRFQDFGTVDPNEILGDRNSGPYFMDDVPVVWNGGIRDHFKGALQFAFQINGRWFDEQMGRFLSEDPMGYQSGRTNLYLLNGNDPFAGTNYSASMVNEDNGPNPFGLYGGFTFGVADALAFGHFDDLIFANGAQAVAAQTDAYWAGLGVGITFQIAAGNLAAGTLGAARTAAAVGTLARTGMAARTAIGAARAFQAYSIAGDAVGVYDSAEALYFGEFSAMDLLGFAPTIGWASKGLGGLKALADVPGMRKRGIQLLDEVHGVSKGLGSQGTRNALPLTASQQDDVMRIVRELGLDPKDFHTSYGQSAFKQFADFDYVQIGPNALPLKELAVTGNTFERLSLRAAIAHEAGHLISTRAGKGFAAGSFEDEIIANIVGRQLPSLNSAERYQLLRYAVELSHQGNIDLRTFLNKLE